MVDEQAARAQRAKGAVAAEGDGGDIVVRADAADHDVGFLGGLSGADRRRAAIAFHPGLGLAHGSVEHGELVTCPGKMTCHWRAHDPQPQKRYFCHISAIEPVFRKR
jgi:hypothetical protein